MTTTINASDALAPKRTPKALHAPSLGGITTYLVAILGICGIVQFLWTNYLGKPVQPPSVPAVQGTPALDLTGKTAQEAPQRAEPATGDRMINGVLNHCKIDPHNASLTICFTDGVIPTDYWIR